VSVAGDYRYAPHGVVFILLLSLISYLLSLISGSFVNRLGCLGALVPFSFLQDEFTGICRRQGFAVFAVGCGEIAT
ncbi:MAG: hypothetical protein ACRDC9_07190, partial [Plesiomonas shigelloides]